MKCDLFRIHLLEFHKWDLSYVSWNFIGVSCFKNHVRSCNVESGYSLVTIGRKVCTKQEKINICIYFHTADSWCSVYEQSIFLFHAKDHSFWTRYHSSFHYKRLHFCSREVLLCHRTYLRKNKPACSLEYWWLLDTKLLDVIIHSFSLR